MTQPISSRPNAIGPLAGMLVAILTWWVLPTVATSGQAEAAEIQLPPVLLQMVRDDAIHKELGLNQAQRDQLLGVLPGIDARWFRARNAQMPEQTRVIDELTGELMTTLGPILTSDQIERLNQLSRQALGTRMVLRPDVTEAMSLTDRQLSSLSELFTKTDKEVARLNKQVFDGELSSNLVGNRIGKVQADERKGMVALLTDRQKALLSPLAGSSFDFSSVKRMYPMPPELESKGVQWVQGGPVDLKSLRGKVVAVHFYAFQCINCIRNLPHYSAWHKDYADQGLVVIGIQTPELSAERNFDRVKAAAASEGIEYPVMLDAEKANWDAWSNTMWPTVYLIDKDGFLRRWWQGEMNWNGTPGEQQMRTTIEQLLAE